jgi:glycosyltransferase involved in cell wall biosynthesis
MANLVKGLLKMGRTVSLVRPRQRCIDNSETRYDYQPILVRGLPLPGYKGLQFGLPAGRLLLNCWKKNHPDAVYIAIEGPLGWSAAGAARRLQIPVFSGFHTNYHVYSQHYRLGWFEGLVFRYLRAFHNRTQGTLVASMDLRTRLESAGFQNVSILDRGVDTDLFTPERRCPRLRATWGLSDSDIAAIYVGRLAPEKNILLAIDAYHAMKLVNPSAQLIVVGDGPIRAALERESPDVIFAGMRTGEDLARHYASGDVFLFPSETETFGNVILEAMASGLPVVAYNYAAAKIHLRDEHSGMLIRYRERQIFIDTVARIARAPEALAQIGRRAREYAATLNWSRAVENFDRLLTNAGAEMPTAIPNATGIGQVAQTGRM